jgi:transaldolase
LVKVPATLEGVGAVETLISEGRSVNVTLIFSLARYRQILDAYLSGLETFAQRGGDLSSVHSVASFFVSRVDTEVDRRLDELGTDDALALKGRAAIAQAKVAYQLYRAAHSGARWSNLARRGARVQRPLWASTSTKDPALPDTMYVEALVAPDTVNTLPPDTFHAYADHGDPHVRITVDAEREAAGLLAAYDALDVPPLAERTVFLEDDGVKKFVGRSKATSLASNPTAVRMPSFADEKLKLVRKPVCFMS